jgi:hypothetical protein
VQLVGGDQPAGELPVPVDVVGVDHVGDTDLGGDVPRRLVDVAADAGVGVRVDEPRRHVLARAVDVQRVDRRGDGERRVGPHRNDLAVGHVQGAVVDDALRAAGPDGGVGHDYGLHLGRRGEAVGAQRPDQLLGRKLEVLLLPVLLVLIPAVHAVTLLLVRRFRFG